MIQKDYHAETCSEMIIKWCYPRRKINPEGKLRHVKSKSKLLKFVYCLSSENSIFP